MTGCQKQERSSQEKLYKHFYPALFALCRKFFTDQHEALTVLNNGMLRAFQHIHQYDAARGSVFTWLYAIVRNAALTRVRDRKDNLWVEWKEQLNVPVNENPFRQLEWKDIYVHLEKLPPTTRAVCSLFYLEGLSVKEISEALQIRDGTVKWHLNESRTRLKILFKNES